MHRDDSLSDMMAGEPGNTDFSGGQTFKGIELEDVGSADMEQNRMSSEKGLMKRIYVAKAFGMQ